MILSYPLAELGDQVEKLTQALESTRREHKFAVEEIGESTAYNKSSISLSASEKSLYFPVTSMHSP